MAKVTWKSEPDDHDYPAAASYLSLVVDDPAAVDRLVTAMAACEVAHHKAKDILRAAQLPLLPAGNPHVARDLRRIRRGKPLSPVLLVRGDLARGLPAQIADGYHRVCASYRTDEDTDIPCRVVTPPPPGTPPAAAPGKRAPVRRTAATSG
jgi:hypothetical protein